MTSSQSAHDHLAGAKLLSLPTPRFKVQNEYDGGSVHAERAWDALPKTDEVEVIVDGGDRGPVDGASPPQLHSTVSARSQGSLVTSDADARVGSRPQSRQAVDQPPRRRHLWPEDICPETAGICGGASSGGASSGKGRRRRRADSYGNPSHNHAGSLHAGPTPSSTGVFPTARSDDPSSGGAESPQPQQSGSVSEKGESPVPVHRHDSVGSAAWIATQGQLQRDAQTPSPPVEGDGESSRRWVTTAGSDHSALQLPLISATPYAESVPLEKGEEVFVAPDSERQKPQFRRGILFFLIACLLSGLAGLALYAAIPHSHGASDIFKPSCNVTAAIECSAKLGEWDNLCDALLSGEQDARTPCCRSPVALSCWHKAFCAIECPPKPSLNTVLLDTTREWDPQDLARTVASQLKRPNSEVTAHIQPCNAEWCRRPNQTHDVDTASLSFCAGGECLPDEAEDIVLQILRRAGDNSDGIRPTLHAYSVPWAVHGGISQPVSLLKNGAFDAAPDSGDDWIVNHGNCTAIKRPGDMSWGQCHNNSMSCVLCQGSTVSMSQEVAADAFPPGTQWTLLGWFSLLGSSGRSSTPLVTLEWCDSENMCSTTESQSVVTANPWATGYLWPKYLPFVWIGKRPDWATKARLTLRCNTDGTDNCLIYFDHPVFTPGSPACNGQPGCVATRCQGGVNTTHDVCQSARICTGRSASPYNKGPDLTFINGSTLWPGFYFKYGTGGSALIGGTIGGHILHESPPKNIKVYQRPDDESGNETGVEIPVACSSAPGVLPCMTMHRVDKPSFFSYTYFFAVNSSDIPQKVFKWRLKDETGAVCVDVSWFVAPEKKHVMDITVDPTSTSMHHRDAILRLPE
eukprot:Hpha_TRINITY_DN15149_c1_g4::TRINITY_DN15149_c1_g4_i1::g.129941::m.129941